MNLSEMPSRDAARTAQSHTLINVAAAIVVVLASGIILYVLEPIFAPTAFALVVGVVLSPLTDRWNTWGLSRGGSALFCLFLTLLVASAFLFAIQPLVSELMAQMPRVWREISETIDTLRAAARSVFETADQINEAFTPETSEQAQSAPAESPLPSMQDAIVTAPTILAQVIVFAGTLFFFLLTRQDIYAWLAVHLRSEAPQDTKGLLLSAERRVARYFGTIALINIALGVVLGAALQALGLPNAPLWGVAATLLNFILYLGPLGLMMALLLAGIAQFDGVLSFAPLAIFVTLNMIEAQFVTPGFVGSHLRINPLVIFLALMFGLWLWGPIGGIVAIPLLVWCIELARVRRTDHSAG